MKYRARCNKRDCQARRNLTKPLEQYVNRPKCHIPGCNGLMYIDRYRQRKGPKDNAAVCANPACQYPQQYHRISTKGCIEYEDYVLSIGYSKHSPIKPETAIDAPF